MGEPECVWDAGAQLGEGPVWDEREQILYWVDIERPAILCLRYHDGKRREYELAERVGCIALRERGGLVAGLQSGFAFVELEGPTVHAIHDPEPELPGNRFNDGKCDPAGRFWAGTMDCAEERPTGALYRLDPDLGVHRMDAGYVITNGPAFSPDGSILYHCDTLARTVFAFDHDPEKGTIDNKRVFAQLGEDEGFPDGLTVDSEGHVWLAHWGGFRVTRFTAGGRVAQVVSLPASQVTSCAFGGPDLGTLFVTTASIGLDAAARAEQPLAGGLFAVDADVVGLPAPRFRG